MRCAPSLCFQTYNLDEQRSGELCSFVALLTKFRLYEEDFIFIDDAADDGFYRLFV